MKRITSVVKRYPLVTFFILAYAFAWGLVLLTKVSLLFGFLALFGPAAAAILVSAASEGRSGVRALFGRVTIWRVGLRWYVVALGLPAVLSLGVVGLGLALGMPAAIQFSELSPLTVTLFILVIGEELGWRGYALPRLQARYGALWASLILGLLWAGWHLPNQLIPGLEFYGYGFPAFALYVVGMTVLFTWLSNHTSGSIWIAWLFHAAINGSGGFLFIGDNERQMWLGTIVFAAAALIIVTIHGANLARRTTTPKESTFIEQPLPQKQ